MSEMATINARVSPQVQEQAAKVLSSMGLSISDAVSALLNWIAVERYLPFKIDSPNAESRVAIAEADKILNSHGARFHTASELFNDIEKNYSGPQVKDQKRSKER